MGDGAAVEVIAQARQREPEDPVLLVHDAVIKMRKGDLVAAVPLLTAATQFGPRCGRARTVLLLVSWMVHAQACRSIQESGHMPSHARPQQESSGRTATGY